LDTLTEDPKLGESLERRSHIRPIGQMTETYDRPVCHRSDKTPTAVLSLSGFVLTASSASCTRAHAVVKNIINKCRHKSGKSQPTSRRQHLMRANTHQQNLPNTTESKRLHHVQSDLHQSLRICRLERVRYALQCVGPSARSAIIATGRRSYRFLTPIGRFERNRFAPVNKRELVRSDSTSIAQVAREQDLSMCLAMVLTECEGLTFPWFMSLGYQAGND
jgi:hypothetical protein